MKLTNDKLCIIFLAYCVQEDFNILIYIVININFVNNIDKLKSQ